MSLVAYAFGGALEGAGKGLAKVGEHRRRMEGERLREKFWKKQSQLNRVAQNDRNQAGIDAQNTRNQAGIDAQNTRNQVGIDAQNARNQTGIDAQNARNQTGIESREDQWDAQLAAARSKASAKQAADEAEVKRNERKAVKEWVEKRLTVTDENTGDEKLDLPKFDYWMNYLDTYKRLPFQVPASWADINRLAETENIPLEDARDRLEQRGHPTPIGDPPSPLTNQGGRLWPGRRKR